MGSVACRLSPVASLWRLLVRHNIPSALQVEVEGLMDGHDLVVQVGSTRGRAPPPSRATRFAARVASLHVVALHVACYSVACGVL